MNGILAWENRGLSPFVPTWPLLLRKAASGLPAVLFFMAALFLPWTEAFATAPAYRASGTFTFGAGTITPPYPATMAANDVCLLAIESENQAIALTTAQGFVQVPTWSPQSAGTAATNPASRLALYWKRTVGGDTAPLVADSGDHTTGQIHCFSGVITSGNPWDTGAGGNDGAVNDTTGTIPGATTASHETLVVLITSNSRNATSAANCSAWTNADLTSLTERADNTNTINLGGGHCMATGVKAVAGAYTTTTVTLAATTYKGAISLALKPVPVTTLADGTDPANSAIAPSAAATMADAFTLQTNTGTDVITAVVVGLGSGVFGGLSLVEITDDAGTTVYGSVAGPASDTPSITLSTNTLTATTTSTQYKIRVTPKSHATMPAPAGSTYSVTAKINSWTGTNSQTGTDTAGTTVTIDNASPANVTAASCTAGAVQIALGWTNPADADFNSVVVLRNTSAVADTPVEGTTTYIVGNTVGASTVACVVATPTATCTDNTAIATGTAYHYKIFARDNNANFSATGVVPTGSPCTPTLSSFNVVEPNADRNSGLIFTKIAGQDISVDIVARNGAATPAITTDFTGGVGVELVDASTGGGVCASMTSIKTLTSQTFIAGDNGRHLISTGQFEANAWRNVKFRIKYPTASPTITSCSFDAFANRPLQFVSILVRDANRTTAGTTNTLSNTSNPGTGTVHNAGRPFRIDATAQNGAGSPAATTLYTADSGQPVAVLSQCGVAAVCPVPSGAVTTTSDYSASNGVITNTTASYNDVGSFNLALEDRTFSAVDAGDGTSTAVRYIPSSAAVTVGRFVPDYFTLEAGSTITPRSDIGACSGSTFTYMSEPMTLVFTLKARDSGNNVTPNYTGATLGALVLNSSGSYSFGAIDSITPTPLTSRLNLSLISGATGSWSAGSAIITAPLALSRAASPDGPYTSLKIGMAPSDPDSVTLQTAALNLDADNSGTPERAQVGPAVTARYGRLRVLGAYGSELLALRVPVQAEYFNGTTWTPNAADGCTSLAANAFVLSGGIAANTSASAVALTAGSGTLTLAKPSPVATGSVDVAVNLGASGNDQSCLGSHGGTFANMSWLRGFWAPAASCNSTAAWAQDPSARVKFGAAKAPYIYLRERY